MKYSIAICLSVIVLLSACSKEDNAAESTGSGYWVTGGDSLLYTAFSQDTRVILSPFSANTYTVNYTGRKDSAGYFILYGYDSFHALSNKIACFFPVVPTINAKYGIADFYPGYQLTANQIGVITSIPSNGTYTASNATLSAQYPFYRIPPDSATVIVNNGKIKIILPTVLAGGIVSNGIDSLFLHGTIEEK